MNKLSKLKQFEINFSNCLTPNQEQAFINNHPLNPNSFGFAEEIKLLCSLEELKNKFSLASDKAEIKEIAYLMAIIKCELFIYRKKTPTNNE